MKPEVPVKFLKLFSIRYRPLNTVIHGANSAKNKGVNCHIDMLH